jgi:hypothetical protein
MAQVEQKDVRLCHNDFLGNGFCVLNEFYFFQLESGDGPL